MEIKTDIQIAQETEMRNIQEIAASAGLDSRYIELYGNYKAKVDYNLLNDKKDEKDGKVILVTAISPTPAGEGKTTTTLRCFICLSAGSRHHAAPLRDP